MLNESNWILINSIGYNIHAISDEKEMRLMVLKQLEKLIDYDVATFYRRLPVDSIEMGDRVTYYANGKEIDEKIEMEIMNYLDTYDKIDYAKGIMYSGENLVYRETDIMPDEERVKTAYYKFVYLPNSWHYSLHLNASYHGEFTGIISLFRDKGKSNFSNQDVYILNMIKNHLALRMFQDNKNSSSMSMQFSECVKTYQLTDKESSVMKAILCGLDNTEICAKFVISPNTLKKHIASIYKKTGFNSKLQIVQNITK